MRLFFCLFRGHGRSLLMFMVTLPLTIDHAPPGFFLSMIVCFHDHYHVCYHIHCRDHNMVPNTVMLLGTD